MSHVKTAFSIEKSLFERIERLAQSMKIPRSRIVALAIKDYLDRLEEHTLLEQINTACSDLPDELERKWLEATADAHAERIKSE